MSHIHAQRFSHYTQHNMLLQTKAISRGFQIKGFTNLVRTNITQVACSARIGQRDLSARLLRPKQ